MTPNINSTNAERGQILVIVAVGLLVMVAMVALVVDGGYAWAKQRDTQNAADAAAEAGATVLMQRLAGVVPAKTDGDVDVAVDQAATDNGTVVDVAYYTDINGDLVTPAGAVTADESAAAVVGAGAIPSGASGVRAVASQDFDTIIAGVMGFQNLTARAPATAVTGYQGDTCPADSGCVVLPVTFPTTIIDCDGSNNIVQQTPATDWPSPSAVTVVPLCSNGPGNVGWLDWTPTAGGASELRDAILPPGSNPYLEWPQWFYVVSTGGPIRWKPRCASGMARSCRSRCSTTRATTPRPVPA